LRIALPERRALSPSSLETQRRTHAFSPTLAQLQPLESQLQHNDELAELQEAPPRLPSPAPLPPLNSGGETGPTHNTVLLLPTPPETHKPERRGSLGRRFSSPALLQVQPK
jgi:hypothetical protein